MKRTKQSEKLNLPDAINCSLTKNFTQVPNDLLRNPNITSKAKAILCLLLSNKEGWHSHLNVIRTMIREGPDAIQSGLQELEKHGYLFRSRYRDKKTKVWKGSFWAYTDIPGQFNVEEQLRILTNEGLEPQPGFPDMGYPHLAYPQLENPDLNNINDKKTNKEKRNISSIKERNGTYLPLAKYLFNIIRTKKNIRGTPLQVDAWADEIRKLIENNEVSYKRVQQALQWYKRNIGGQYIPVIESGQALRNKFIKLEDAMDREKRFTPDKPKYKIEYGQRWELQKDGQYRTADGTLLMED